jgi:hypothetical protein
VAKNHAFPYLFSFENHMHEIEQNCPGKGKNEGREEESAAMGSVIGHLPGMLKMSQGISAFAMIPLG